MEFVSVLAKSNVRENEGNSQYSLIVVLVVKYNKLNDEINNEYLVVKNTIYVCNLFYLPNFA